MNPRSVPIAPFQVTTKSFSQVPARIPISREGGTRPSQRSSTPLSKSDLTSFHETHFPKPPSRIVQPATEDVPDILPSQQILAKRDPRGYSSSGDGKIVRSKVPEKSRNPTVKIPHSTFDEEVPVREVFERIDDHIDDCNINEKYVRKRVGVTVACFCSSLVGIFMIILGLGETELFSSWEPNQGVFIAGCLFHAPWLYWFYVFACPSKREKKERRENRANKERRKEGLKHNDARLIIDSSSHRREMVMARKKAEMQKQLDAIEFKKKNPLGYPTLGTTRHPNPW